MVYMELHLFIKYIINYVLTCTIKMKLIRFIENYWLSKIKKGH